MGKITESSFVKEFKEFVSRGSVMDLAVGMVIGAAFSAIVTSAVNDIIMPMVGLLIGGVNFSDLRIVIPNIFGGNTAAVIAYGNFIQQVVNFLVIALALFVAIRLINKFSEKAKKLAKKEDDKKQAAEDKKEDETVKLLKEIRDSLKKK
ncbi:large-conductance mechanosensitive channel protein MscL [Candidatus Saccharibacteria bacterium]|nr:large-conductance mechanosensitive channel protein MscL [Candidatus Saccharibacteria bacterium]